MSNVVPIKAYPKFKIGDCVLLMFDDSWPRMWVGEVYTQGSGRLLWDVEATCYTLYYKAGDIIQTITLPENLLVPHK